MGRPCRVAYLALALLPAPLAAQTPEREAVERAIARVGPALVRILVAEKRFEGGREEKAAAAGSGFIIDAVGHIVTNHHVAGEAKRLIVTLADRRQVEADLVGTDALTDIAVIKLRGERTDYPYAAWGDSSTLKVGSVVLAMGSPLALSQSVTQGIVSNTEMVVPDFASGYSVQLQGEDVGSMVRWIGHDAAIKPGNSGGPLVNLAGEVVGINELEMGLAGAIPSNLARSVAAGLIANGRIRRGWLGIGAQPLLRGSTVKSGVLVGGVVPGSPAAEAGLKAGDIITKVNDTEVSVRFSEELPGFNQLLASLPIGSSAVVTALRDGRETRLTMTVEERQESEPPARELRAWGMCAGNVSRESALDQGRKTTDGVLVWNVRASGPAGSARPALQGDDIIVAVDRRPVKDIDSLEAMTKALYPGGDAAPRKVLVTFEREAERLVTVVELGRKDDRDESVETRPAWLAVGTQVLTPDVAEALGVAGRKGVRVTRVDDGSTAQKAGLQVGDLVVAVDDTQLEATQPEQSDEFAEVIRQYSPNDTVALTLIREGKPVKVNVRLATAPVPARELKRYRDDNFEFTARDTSYDDTVTNRVARGVTGVMVDSVSEGGWAALGRLQPGDVILSVNGKPTPAIGALETIMKEIAATKPKTVVLHVARRARQLFVEMEADWSSGL